LPSLMKSAGDAGHPPATLADEHHGEIS